MLAVSVAIAALIPATLAAGYYFVLTTLGWWPRRSQASAEARFTFAVLIPAHNEELSLEATIQSVFRSEYPADRLRILVVADNCTDRTAEIARAAGAECIERVDPLNRGKGYALAVGIPAALKTGADAVLILDADCELDPGALRSFAAAFANGCSVAQAAVVARNPNEGPTGQVTAVGATIDNAIAAGLTRLGRTAPLRGTGMAFAREVLERFPWTAFGLTEDAEYAARLKRAGIRVAFRGDAIIRSEAPAGLSAFRTQRRRWRAALRIKDRSLLARWLSSKPLVLAQLGLALLAVGGLLGLMPFDAAIPFASWCGVLVALTAAVYVRALARAGVALGGAAGVVRIVGVVGRLGWLTLGALSDRGRTWRRTPRVAKPALTTG